MTEAKFPVKTREFHNPHFDSTVWNDFVFRDDDIVISTYAKSGTTWMQQIVSQLLFSGDIWSVTRFVIANKNGRWRKLKDLDFYNLG